jgi:hypothetical protein
MSAYRTPVEIGQALARQVFAKRGNHSEAHLSEVELAACIALGVQRSAAPDLSEALRDVMPLLAECDCIHSDREAPLCPCRAARDALAKAGL